MIYCYYSLQEYKKAQQLTDHVPIKEILREPPKSRLISRRPLVFKQELEIWEQSWIEGVPPGPGFTLPRRQFFTLNRLRCGHARCAESLYRWDVIASPACPSGESHQTTRHTVDGCRWRPATSTRSGSRRSGMVAETIYETVREFQTYNKTLLLVIAWSRRIVDDNSKKQICTKYDVTTNAYSYFS